MPFLTLQPDSVIRLNDTTETSASAGQKYLSSYYSRRVKFPFEDPYDVPWQQWHYNNASADFEGLTPSGNHRIYTVDPDQIYDRVNPPILQPEIIRNMFLNNNILDYKNNFPGYVDPQNASGRYEYESMHPERVVLGSNSLFALERNDFLKYVFDAYWHQSFYRYAAVNLFRHTGELSVNPGYFVRRGFWGYFTPNALTGQFNDGSGGPEIRNVAKSKLSTLNNIEEYVNWIDKNVSLFNAKYGWVGLSGSNSYRGWLKYACTEHEQGRLTPSISTYYNNKLSSIYENEGKSPIYENEIIFAETVNELYENLTQINRIISRELSLLLSSSNGSDHQPPPELVENGYITIKFNCANCNLGSSFERNDEHKLGTCGYTPIYNAGTAQEYKISCEYGELYDVIDFERLLNKGREDNVAFPIISAYLGNPPTAKWCFATNPYDRYVNSLINPTTTDKNRGRGRTEGDWSDVMGNGLWSGVSALKTQNNDGIPARKPDGRISAFSLSGDIRYMSTAYAYWCEKDYYDSKGSYTSSGTPNGKFQLYTVSNIREQPNSGYHIIWNAYHNTPNESLMGMFLSTGGYPRESVASYFPQYMHVRLRAVEDKTYYPVYDCGVSREILDMYRDPLEFQFDSANIKVLRTGINPGTSHIVGNRLMNEDPYYMKYGAFFEGDSRPEREDQETGSRPISPDDAEWKKVCNALLNSQWYGDYFILPIDKCYLNPMGECYTLDIRANVTDISFLIGADISLKKGYSFESQVICSIHSRIGADEASRDTRIPLYDMDNKLLHIMKGNDALTIAANNTDRKYRFKIGLFQSTDCPRPNNTGLWYNRNDCIDDRIALKLFDVEAFRSTFRRDRPSDALSALLYQITNDPNGLFPGSGSGSAGGVGASVSYVFWMNHYIQTTADHELEGTEHFYLPLRGFCFGVKYD